MNITNAGRKMWLSTTSGFHVRLRDGMGYRSVAMVTTDGKMEWMDKDGLVSATVKEAMAELEANMESDVLTHHGSRQWACSTVR